MTAAPPAPLDRARSLAPLIRAQAPVSESQRTLSKPVVDALWASGLMQWMNPREAEGSEPSLPELIDVWQELAWQDASVGWIGIANWPSAAFAAAYLPDAGFEEVFERNAHRVTLAGQFAPRGQGVPVEGGYRVTGAWNFGSGTGHSHFIVGGFLPSVPPPEGQLPELLVAVFPRDDVVLEDGWHVTGLRGTGSFDYRAEDVLVPHDRVFPLLSRQPQRGGPLFRLGILPITAAGHAAWALGVARSALDDVMELAREKVRMGDPAPLAHKLTFQRDLAHHEAMWRAARELVVQTFARVGDSVRDGGDLSAGLRADARLAATYATQAAREVVEFAHLGAGTTAIREGSRLERAFRDLYTGTQHTFINEKTYTDAAGLLLGLQEDVFGL
ncbi:MAG: acyl-CoA dehydrogenase [Proteobacteria bacterium]|nr:acyl-CoA dehydrogenase [Pseudomonadota bacterium]